MDSRNSSDYGDSDSYTVQKDGGSSTGYSPIEEKSGIINTRNNISIFWKNTLVACQKVIYKSKEPRKSDVCDGSIPP